jgi:hypothetical protein
MIENTIQKLNDAEKHQRMSSKIRQMFRLWLPFWSQLLETFQGWRAFFATYFSEPLGGTRLNQFWPPLGHPWSEFVTFLKDNNR